MYSVVGESRRLPRQRGGNVTTTGDRIAQTIITYFAFLLTRIGPIYYGPRNSGGA